MAFEKLGIEIVVNANRAITGIQRFANAMLTYNGAVKRTESAINSWAKAQTRAAAQAATAQRKIAEGVDKQAARQIETYNRLQAKLSQLNQRRSILADPTGGSNTQIAALQKQIDMYSRMLAKMRQGLPSITDPASLRSAQSEISKLEKKITALRDKMAKIKIDIKVGNTPEIRKTDAAIQSVEQQIRETEDALMQLQGTSAAAWQSYSTEAQKASQSAQEVAGTQEQLSASVSGLGGIFNVIFGQNLEGQFEAIGKGASFSALQTTALRMGLQGAASAASFLVSAGVGVLRFLGNLASMAWTVVKAVAGLAIQIGQKLLSALAKLAAAPFKIIINALKSIKQLFSSAFAVTIGMSTDRILWAIGIKLREVAQRAFEAAVNFQLLEVRLEGLVARELFSGGKVESFTAGLSASIPVVKELFNWTTRLAVTSPFSIQDVANTLTLASSYGFATDEAKKFTESIVNFASGMGLTGDSITRIVENFGQMRAAGKLTGTELRDLARGAFLPIADILDVVGDKFGITGNEVRNLGKTGKDLVTTMEENGMWEKVEKGPVDAFIEGFMDIVARDFPNAAQRTTKTFTVAVSNAWDAIEGLVGRNILGSILAPISGRISDTVSKLFTPEMIDVTARFGNALEVVVDYLIGIFDAAAPAESALGTIKNIMNDIADGIEAATTLTVPGGTFIEQNLAGFVGKDFKLPDDKKLLSPLAKNVMQFVIDAKTRWIPMMMTTIKELTSDPIGFFQKKVLPWLGSSAFKILGTTFKFIGEKIKDLWQITKEKLPVIANAIVQFVQDGLNSLSSWAEEKGGVVKNTFDIVKNVVDLVDLFLNPRSDLKEQNEAISGKIDAIKTSFEGLKEKLDPIIQGVLSDFKDWVLSTFPGLQNISTALSSITGLNFDDVSGSIERLSESISKISDVVIIIFNIADGFFNLALALAAFSSSVSGIDIGQWLSGLQTGGVKEWSEGFKAISREIAKTFLPGGEADSLFKDTQDTFDISFLENIDLSNVNSVLSVWSGLTDKQKEYIANSPGFIEAVRNEKKELDDPTRTSGSSALLESEKLRVAAILPEIERMYSEHSEKIKQSYQGTADAVVGHSIVPDMMVEIQNVIRSGFDAVIAYLGTARDQLTAAIYGDGLTGVGGQMMTDIAMGVESMLPSLLAYLRSVAQAIRSAGSVTLSISYSISVPKSSTVKFSTGGGNCFIGETQVNIPGGTIDISKINIGDTVLVYDTESKKVVESVVVLKTRDRRAVVKVKFESGKSFVCTPDHRWLTTMGWTEAGALFAGDTVICGYDDVDIVASVVVHYRPQTVYNIHVKHSSHTYMVDGHVVHNIKTLAAGGPASTQGQIVGERGVEWFEPKVPGFVLSKNNVMKALQARLSNPYPQNAARTINQTNIHVSFYGTQNYNLNNGDSMIDFIRRQKAFGG